MRGRIALQKHLGAKYGNAFPRFVRQLPDFGSARASSRRFGPLDPRRRLDTQKSSGSLSPSVLNEYTDLTKPDRALLSNQAAEHHGY